MMKWLATMVFWYCFSIDNNIWAQIGRESEQKIVTDLMEKWIENTEAVLDYSDLQEQLEYHLKHKLNLNKANRFAFEQLFFLNETAINAILEHREKYGDFLAVYELQTIESLDERTVYYLSYFVKVGEYKQVDMVSIGKQLKEGKHEILLLGEGDREQRNGYLEERRDSGQAYYPGTPLRLAVRYRFQYNNNLSFGYSGEKDAGETFNSKTGGFDFTSAHFCIKDLGIVRTLALGDYQVGFGQGLTFATGLSASKSAYVLNVRKGFQPIRPYRSLNEFGYLRGAAINLKYRKWEWTTFVSRKKISTNLQDGADSADTETFSSVLSNGLHRTETERNNRNNVSELIAGAHLRYRNNRAEAGLTAAHAWYSNNIINGGKPYQLYQFSGMSLTNLGIDYGWIWHNYSFFGETAVNDNNGFAILSGVTAALHQKLDWVLVYRNYSKSYQAIYNNPFGENAGGQNEKGVYSGVSFKPIRKWVLNVYADLYQSGWLRYLTDAPSHGADYLGEIQFNPDKKVQFYLRVHTEEKMKNEPGNTTPVDYVSHVKRNQYRLHAQYPLSETIQAKSRLEMVRFTSEKQTPQQGVLVFQDINYAAASKKFSVALRLAVFSVEDYNARIYATEQDVLYQYAVPLYQNSGTRYYAVIHWRLNRRIDCWLKCSQTRYSNISTIGSGLDQIQGNMLNSFCLQVRLKL